MILEIRISEDYCRSDIYIVDLSRFTLGHMSQFTFPLIEKYFLCAFVSTIYRYNNNNNNNTYSMVIVVLEKVNGLQPVKEFSAFLWNPKIHYRTHKRPPPVPVLGQPNTFHIPTFHLLEIHPNIFHPSTPMSPQWSLPHWFPQQDPIRPLSSPILATSRPILFFSI
jgi:hypothetical protein